MVFHQYQNYKRFSIYKNFCTSKHWHKMILIVLIIQIWTFVECSWREEPFYLPFGPAHGDKFTNKEGGCPCDPAQCSARQFQFGRCFMLGLKHVCFVRVCNRGQYHIPISRNLMDLDLKHAKIWYKSCQGSCHVTCFENIRIFSTIPPPFGT